MKLLLRSPLHGAVSKRLMLLTMTGRKSGKQYRIPVGYTQVAETLYFGTNGLWKNNLRGGAPVRVRLRGKDCAARAYVIADQEGMERSYALWLPQSPQYAQVIGMPLRKGDKPDPAYVAYLREHGHVIVRLELDRGLG